MTILTALWTYRRLIALVSFILIIGGLGVTIWAQRATIAGHVETIAAKDKEIVSVTNDRDQAIRTNAGIVTAFDQYKTSRDAADALAADDAKRVTERTESVATIHREISNVARPAGPPPVAGPYTATALNRLRALKAGSAADAHPNPGGAGAGPGAAASVPAGSGHP